MLRHLLVPTPLGVPAGTLVVAERDGVLVASSYFTSDQVAVLHVTAGPLSLRWQVPVSGGHRWSKGIDVDMPARDALLGGTDLRLTSAWREWLRVRNLDHEERIAHERGL